MATKLVVAVLCAARVGADLHRGPLGSEGEFALILSAALISSLFLDGARWIALRVGRALATDEPAFSEPARRRGHRP